MADIVPTINFVEHMVLIAFAVRPHKKRECVLCVKILCSLVLIKDFTVACLRCISWVTCL